MAPRAEGATSRVRVAALLLIAGLAAPAGELTRVVVSHVQRKVRRRPIEALKPLDDQRQIGARRRLKAQREEKLDATPVELRHGSLVVPLDSLLVHLAVSGQPEEPTLLSPLDSPAKGTKSQTEEERPE